MPGRRHRRDGFTLVEAMLVVAIMGVVMIMAIPAIGTFISRQNVRHSARQVADALLQARAEAMRSGVNHVVLMSIGAGGTDDPRGTALVDESGAVVEVTILGDDDGDCSIDVGETTTLVSFEPNVGWGVTNAGAVNRAPLDDNVPPIAFGSTFADPALPAAAVRWFLFGPDGVPLSFEGNVATGCGTMGTFGDGNGGLYLTDGGRDYAIVLTALGGLRLHAFDIQTNQWSQ